MAQRLIILLAAGVVAVYADADNLPDPTRPPAMVEPVGGVAGGVLSGTLVLQSIMWSASRRQAVISGQLAVEGDRIGDSKLLRIGENEVELDGPEGRQVVKLLPGIEKTPSMKKVSKP